MPVLGMVPWRATAPACVRLGHGVHPVVTGPNVAHGSNRTEPLVPRGQLFGHQRGGQCSAMGVDNDGDDLVEGNAAYLNAALAYD